MEKADLPRPCIFSTNGCLFEDNVESLIIHEEICNYRIVSCPDPECDIKPIEKDVIPHLIEDHLGKHCDFSRKIVLSNEMYIFYSFTK